MGDDGDGVEVGNLAGERVQAPSRKITSREWARGFGPSGGFAGLGPTGGRFGYCGDMSASGTALDLVRVFAEAALAVEEALVGVSIADRRRVTGSRPNQYVLDLVADEASVPLLVGRGLSVHSEESGVHDLGGEIVVVLDPVDGSRNCSRGLPWYGPSFCAVDSVGPLAALVVNFGTGTHFSAVRGGGAGRDGEPVAVSEVASLAAALISSDVGTPLGAGLIHTRNLGASAHSMCLVAEGAFDGYVDVRSWQRPWDYLGAGLVVTEAGGVLVSSDGPLVYRRGDDSPRRLFVASTPSLLDELVRVFILPA